MTFRVMLAPHEDPMSYPEYFDKLKYPLLVSPKYDGIRCIVKNKTLMSRTFKPLPNLQCQDLFKMCEDYDGEIIVGDPTAPDVYNKTQSYVMSRDKLSDEVSFFVFDYTPEHLLLEPFSERLTNLQIQLEYWGHENVFRAPQIFIKNHTDLLHYEEVVLQDGYEGLILRGINSPYKNGRGTFREGYIYKLKRFQDDEAIVVGFVEQQENLNEAFRDERGYSKRSSAQDGKVGAGTLGKFLADYKGMDLEVPPGILNHSQRKHIWDNQDQFRGLILKFRHFPVGVKDKPRFPRFVGWRDKIDL